MLASSLIYTSGNNSFNIVVMNPSIKRSDILRLHNWQRIIYFELQNIGTYFLNHAIGEQYEKGVVFLINFRLRKYFTGAGFNCTWSNATDEKMVREKHIYFSLTS